MEEFLLTATKINQEGHANDMTMFYSSHTDRWAIRLRSTSDLTEKFARQ